MGRYRAPQPPSSPYITAAGARRLRQELQHLWRVERPEVTRALSAAAAEGDRSENAEYIYRKKQLAGIDRRVRYLSRRLEQVQVVEGRPADPERVFFSATVAVCWEDGREARWRIVGADETDAERGWISVDSPTARALLGCRVGDEVKVELPEGPTSLEILSINYEENNEAGRSD